MDAVIRLVEALGFWGWITIMAVSSVCVGAGIEAYVKIKRMQIKHIERMAKIQQGIDPGDETEAYRKDAL